MWIENGLFDKFDRTAFHEGELYYTDYFGGKIAKSLDRFYQMPGEIRSLAGLCLPDKDLTMPQIGSEDYWEWGAILHAVANAGETFRMVELGGGYGRWVVNAANALRRYRGKGPRESHFVCVEVNKWTFEELKEHLSLNDVDPASYTLICGAVVPTSERDRPTFMTLDRLGDGNPKYGFSIDTRPELAAAFPPGVEMHTFERFHEDGRIHARQTVQKCRTYTLADIIDGKLTDIVDIDVQGTEAYIIPEDCDVLNKFVKYLFIGTHPTGGEQDVLSTLKQNGWNIMTFFPTSTEITYKEQKIYIGDGIIVAANSRLTDMG